VNRQRKIMLGVAAAALATTAATALAEPARNATLSPGGAGYSWDSPPLNGAAADSSLPLPCGPGKDCDDTLIKLTDRGQLVVKISSEDPNARDLDLYLYKSDDSGEPGQVIKASTSPESNEQVTASITGGTYLARVVAATAVNGTYKGQASVGVLPPLDKDDSPPDFGPDPAPGPGDSGSGSGGGTGTGTGGGQTGGNGETVAPVGNIAPETAVRRPTRRALTGVARDRDGKVAYVDVAIVRVSGGKCTALRVGGRFRKISKCEAPPFLRARGTTSWKLKLKRPLKAGRYVVFAVATDEDGKAEGGFGSLNRRSFRIR
jgi:hypothetical protein